VLTYIAIKDTMKDMEDLMTVQEFADHVRMHYNSIVKAIRAGRINAFRITSGKRAPYRIPKSEINRIAMIDLEKIVNQIVSDKVKKNKDT